MDLDRAATEVALNAQSSEYCTLRLQEVGHGGLEPPSSRIYALWFSQLSQLPR